VAVKQRTAQKADMLTNVVARCRERLGAVRAELAQQARNQSSARLETVAAELGQMEAAAREEGEARCATVQVWLWLGTFQGRVMIRVGNDQLARKVRYTIKCCTAPCNAL